MKLYIVPTPIGNLKDITLRAIEVLKMADLILCEDTRTSQVLLKHYGIEKKLFAFHQHNEHASIAKVILYLKTQNIALISDAGTPGISDPCFLLVRECIKNNIEIEALPGPTAFVPAIVKSGITTNRFVFEGFLPLKKGRHTLLTKLIKEDRSIIIYESPKRILKTLKEMTIYFGVERKICVCKEISKLHETYYRGTLNEVIQNIENPKATFKGELVLIIEGSKT